MNSKITIASMNIESKSWSSDWDGYDYLKILANYIKKYNITYFGAQEIMMFRKMQLQKRLGDTYYIVGNSNYGRLSFLSNSEINPVITRNMPLEVENRHLTLLPNVCKGNAPRILTTVKTDENFIINTKLEPQSNKARIKELKVLLEHIKNYKDFGPILLGEFYMTESDPDFQKFIREMEKLGLVHISNKDMENSKGFETTNHVFVSDAYEILESRMVSGEKINKISNSKLTLCKVEKKTEILI